MYEVVYPGQVVVRYNSLLSSFESIKRETDHRQGHFSKIIIFPTNTHTSSI